MKYSPVYFSIKFDGIISNISNNIYQQENNIYINTNKKFTCIKK